MSSTTENLEKVIVSEGALTLPTYELEGENRNPVFRSQYGVAHIYPYTLQDEIASKPTHKTYRTLILENRYLRLTVLPDLGGRVYSVYDKISEREVFYKNDWIKFSPLAIRGAFFSGGVEFSFPVAHAPTTADPVNWDIRQNPDGSATVTIGGLEHISRMRWSIRLSLFPDRCALAQDVQLYNPYSLPGRYHYWTNASLEANDGTEFIYPLRRVRSYEFAGTASWPVGRLDLIQGDPGLPGMEGVPMWPARRMLEPVDFRYQRNMLAQVSIFGRDVTWDFFGAWQHSANHGYAHFADHKNVSGMKLWSWGNAEVGVVNQTALTDDGSVYAETQCGAMETQLDFAFLGPAAQRSWREWWLPLRGLGGLTCASAECGALLKLIPDTSGDMVNLKIGVCPARELGESTIEVAVPGKVLVSLRAILSPERPWQSTLPVFARDLADYPIHLTVLDQDGATVLVYTLDREPSPIPALTSKANNSPKTSQEFYLLGLKHENFDNREQAQAAYDKAIRLDAENGEAHVRLGLMSLRAGNFPKAREHFKKAISCDLAEGHYYLGLISQLERQPRNAAASFNSVPAGHSLSPMALMGLGCLAMQAKDWGRAMAYFERARLQDSQSISANLLMGMAQQRNGLVKEARHRFDWVLARDPLNHIALRELTLLQPDAVLQSKLTSLLSDDRQYQLDLACTYFNAGLVEDALAILKDSFSAWPYPMLAYLGAYFAHTAGQDAEAHTWLEKAAAGSPEYVFPNRLEEFIALNYAVDQSIQDYKARYYLGNFLYAHQNYEEGVRMWQKTLPGLANFDVLYRNLGLAAWQRQGNLPKAIEYFEKGLALNPENQDLYLHLDDLYKITGSIEQRRELLEKILALGKPREDVHKRSILMLVDLGRYEDALSIMQSQQFVPLEMDQSFHDLYARAILQRAEALEQGRQFDEAVAEYQRALEFPSNLGVGKPTTSSQAHIYYRMGLAYERLGRFREALTAWRMAALEHHPHGSELYESVQMALDKLSRYSELGFE